MVKTTEIVKTPPPTPTKKRKQRSITAYLKPSSSKADSQEDYFEHAQQTYDNPPFPPVVDLSNVDQNEEEEASSDEDQPLQKRMRVLTCETLQVNPIPLYFNQLEKGEVMTLIAIYYRVSSFYYLKYNIIIYIILY